MHPNGSLVLAEQHSELDHSPLGIPSMLTTAGLALHEMVQGLGTRMRCRECDGTHAITM
jgi:hypothetical protein